MDTCPRPTDAAKEVGILVAIERPHFALRIEKDPHTLRGPLQGTALVVYELPHDIDRYYIYKAGDLRRKETVRLIDAAQKVAAKICGEHCPLDNTHNLCYASAK